MSGVQELFIALIVLYLFECVLVVRRDMLLIRSLGLGKFKATPAVNLPGSPERALFFSMPAPPLGAVYLTQSSPLTFTSDGVSTRRAEHFGCESEALEPATFTPFEDVKSVRADGVAVKVNDEAVAQLCTPAVARALAVQIDELRSTPDAALRERLILRALDARFDVDAARTRREETERDAWTLLVLCNLLCGFLFGVVPLTVWRSGLGGTWVMLLIALVGLWACIAAEFVRVHRRLAPEASADRRQRFAVICCTPLSAVRAYESLLRDRLADFHPLVVAAVTCETADARDLAAAMLRDIEFPCRALDAADGSMQADNAAAWTRTQVRDRIVGIVRELEMSEQAALSAPQPDGADSIAYCPRCHTQFVRNVDACPHCPGVPVRAFDGAAMNREAVSEGRA